MAGFIPPLLLDFWPRSNLLFFLFAKSEEERDTGPCPLRDPTQLQPCISQQQVSQEEALRSFFLHEFPFLTFLNN